ncbi:type VI secretion system amidase effector protein Tae4 [Marinomonas sp. RSW2]|uniref:Type VI secretion system amidase effector protein Tae4 n=1 Tax=Marinomonas maritima TaxID=2940935 RepID=A0ABT5W9R3_9GAMM|nr:type VI secretion system amidase effector protein Tae4 [Marinomonas maritima]MDE8601442.1 type VI secretion system amidase effector protein Tae4 [Marinomonas maritima]
MLKFNQLWNDFPEKNIMRARCQNKQSSTSSSPFGNYCAIMLSDALIKSGVSTNSAKVKKCWSHQGGKHILLAEEMAKWLNTANIGGINRVEKISPTSFQKDLDGRTGIIFFKDYWQRGNESLDNRSGDHIDLWNKNEISSTGMFMRSIYEFFGAVSDLNKSKEVWFWEIK